MDNPDELRELFSAFGPVRVRRMFGGAGIFADGLMIALVSGGDIFLKADVATIPTLEAEGSRPFVYGAKGRRVVMSYWRLPDRLLDDPEELAQFARAALGAAHPVCGEGRFQAHRWNEETPGQATCGSASSSSAVSAMTQLRPPRLAA